ncbi:MAG: D-allose transporter substrate-binding protein [Actinobacteria bacterium]|nr:D-allose transporter substrate-binding protein [Actinomycetota bacterium]
MKKSLKGVAALAAALSLSLAACASTPQSGGATTAPGGETPAPGGDVKVAVILKTLGSEFWQNMKAGIEDEAAKLGVEVDIQAGNSEDDVEGQVNLVQNVISKGYDAIGVAPISPVNLNNVLAEATKAGIKIVNIDEQVDLENLRSLGGGIQAFVTTNNVEVGQMAGEFLTKQLTKGDQVAIIEGKAGVSSGEARKQGATEAFEAAGMEIVASQPADWDRTRAFDMATNFINKFGDLKAIYCANDTMAMGAQEAVEKSGKQILVVGTDGNSDAIESVQAGGLAATVKQDTATVGSTALNLLLELGGSDEAIDIAADPELVYAPPVLITKEG